MHVGRSFALWLGVGLALGAGGCARRAVVFDGSSHPAIAGADQLRELSSLPDGYETIGEVSARCELVEGERPPDGAPLVDVDCTESRLSSAIRERAAEVGGEVLVGKRCRSRVTDESDRSTRLAIFCEAEVARPTETSLARRPLVTGVLGEVGEPRAAEAWNIEVHFAPTPGMAPRPARRSAFVREVPLMPLSHVRLGDVTTSCETGCTREGARRGLLAAAGRFGATDVAEVRCAAQKHGWTCVGTAAVHEVDPELDPRAR